MAYLIPDNLRSRKDVPDSIRRVAGAFASGLEEDSTVWYEPLFDPTAERPHLVVLDPRIGIVVLEVLKVDEKRRLLGGLRGKVRLDVDGVETEVENPLERAARLASSLKSKLAASPGLERVPVGAVAVLPTTTRRQAEDLGLATIVDLDACVFKPDLDQAISESNGSPIVRVFTQVCRGTLETELPEQALDVLRGLIHPEVVIASPSPTAEQGALFSAILASGDIIKVMDRKQEAFAKSLGTGHRVIRGVAGSGKTLALVHRARLLAKLLPSQRILLTCYTKSLASQLAAQVSMFPNIDVVNLDKLMGQVIRSANMKFPGYEPGALPVATVALEAVKVANHPKYRAVMVDEAQDFDADALRFCLEMLEATNPDAQDLIIVADSAQNIFRKNFRWKDAGIQAQGRTRMLRVNYRNTRQILESAHAFLTADPTIEVDVEADDGLSVIPAESCEREGPVPTILVGESIANEVQLVVEQVQKACEGAAKSRSVAVLVGEGSGPRQKMIVEALQKAGIDTLWVTDPTQKANKERAGSALETVIVSTIQSAKGLEFPSVVVCGLGVRDDALTARKLNYVGFTRAVNNLSVVVATDSPFRKDIESAAAAKATTATV